MILRRDFDVAQDLLDVNGIAEIPANIFAEALHGKIFIQMPGRANNFKGNFYRRKRRERRSNDKGRGKFEVTVFEDEDENDS